MTNAIGWGAGLAVTAAAAVIAMAAFVGLRPAPEIVTVGDVTTSGDALTWPETAADVARRGDSAVDTSAPISDPARATAEEPATESARAPTVDVVRIDAGGSAVVAGTAERNAQIVLRIDGKDVATAQTDAAGNFVSLFDVGVAEVPRVLTFEAQGPATDGSNAPPVVAPDRIIVAPVFPATPAIPSVAPPATATATEEVERLPSFDVAATIDGSSADEPTVDAPSGEVGPAVTEGVTELAPPDPPVADAVPVKTAASLKTVRPDAPGPPRLFRDGPGGLTVLTAGRVPDATQVLAIDAISYDAQGDVSLTGTGARNSEVRIYIDGAPVQLARVGAGGTWSSPLPNIDSGVYTLRVDALAADGAVTARVETPFQRTAPDVAAASRRDGVSAITVQPGFTLWAISEGYFGNGIQYVQIFETNRDQIRDPDLIYPGQVFNLPRVD